MQPVPTAKSVLTWAMCSGEGSCSAVWFEGYGEGISPRGNIWVELLKHPCPLWALWTEVCACVQLCLCFLAFAPAIQKHSCNVGLFAGPAGKHCSLSKKVSVHATDQIFSSPLLSFSSVENFFFFPFYFFFCEKKLPSTARFGSPRLWYSKCQCAQKCCRQRSNSLAGLSLQPIIAGKIPQGINQHSCI